MSKLDFEMLKLKAQDLIAVPHCYGELKEKAQQWIDSVGTDNEIKARKTFIDELKEDVIPIDGLIGFTQTEKAFEMFGKESCELMREGAIAAKSKGEKYCTCAACQAGKVFLEIKEFLEDT